MNNLPTYLETPSYLSTMFLGTALLTLYLFWRALNSSSNNKLASIVIFGLILWSMFQALLSYSGFYRRDLLHIPPRFILLILPFVVAIMVTFFIEQGRNFIRSISLERLTWISIVRIPVEISLLLIFKEGFIPRLMTFEGWNFDIIAGISAPWVIYAVFKKEKLNKWILTIWNVASLILLLSIIILAVLSAPSALQLFGQDQPNIALIYPPYFLLPSLIVPIVLFSHLASLCILAKNWPEHQL